MKAQRRFLRVLVAFAFSLGLVGMASAAWRPGLFGGFVSGGANKTDFPAVTNSFDGPFAATNRAETVEDSTTYPPVWAPNRTWVYWGEIYLPEGNCSFAAKMDDYGYLAIDGTVLFENNAYWTIDRSGTRSFAEGWHTFEVRFGNASGSAGPSANIPVGFGINRSGLDSDSMDDYEYLFDPMGLFPVVFRHDDGLSAGDNLVITGAPYPYGKASPDYGTVRGLSSGEPLSCSAPEGVVVAPGRKAYSEGWKLYDVDRVSSSLVPVKSGSGREMSYVHGERERLLEWQWVVSNQVEVTSSEGGSVDFSNGWVRENSILTLTATPAVGHVFLKWTGDVPRSDFGKQTLPLKVSRPLSLQAVFVPAGDVVGQKTWTGAGDGLRWEDGTNWSPEGVPGYSDDVTIDTGAVCAETTVTARSISIGPEGELWLGSSNKVENAIALAPLIGKNYEFNVLGDVSCSGALVLGGADLAGILSVNVQGDLLAADGAKIAVHAARASSSAEAVLRSECTPVSIGGKLAVAPTAVLYIDCDGVTGSHVAFDAEDVVIDGLVNVESRGWKYIQSDNPPAGDLVIRDNNGDGSVKYYTYAYGPGQYSKIGGGHGGRGGNASDSHGLAYDNPYVPCLPGSPTGCYYPPKRGGGVIRMAARNRFILNGTLDADGGIPGDWGCGGQGGGSIWIDTPRFEMDDKALMTARGSEAGNHASGGGGIIGVTVGLSARDIESVASGVLPEGVRAGLFPGAADVHGGRADFIAEENDYYYAPDGIVSYLHRDGAPVNVHVSTEPSDVAVLEPPSGWGVRSFDVNHEIVLTTPMEALDPVSGDTVRFSCTGYVVSNVTGVVLEGNTNEVTIPAGGSPFWLTWKYGKKEGKISFQSIKNGALSIEEVPHSENFSIWLTEGAAPVPVVAVPSDGYEFLYWLGDVPYGKTTENPLQLMMDTPRTMQPVFRRAEPRQTRIWSAKKIPADWLDPNNWEPAGNVPGLDDDVIISNQICLVPNYVECASLTLSGQGVLRLASRVAGAWNNATWLAGKVTNLNDGNDGSEKLGEIALVVKENLVMKEGAQLGLGTRHQPGRGRVSVGGNFRLTGSNLVSLAAGPIDGVQTTHETGSGSLQVGGTLEIGEKAALYLVSDGYTGGSYVLRPRKLVIRKGGLLSAYDRGYGTAKGSDAQLAPGRPNPNDGKMAASHGGLGSANYKPWAQPYGQANAPIEPGSSSRKAWWGTPSGGGLLRVHAESIDLAGECNVSAPWGRDTGGGSGGGIWMTARFFSFGKGAVLDASGAEGRGYFKAHGGGGRIALEKGLSSEAIDSLAQTGELPEALRKKVMDAVAFTNRYKEVTVDVSRFDHHPDGEGTFVYLDATPGHTLLILR